MRRARYGRIERLTDCLLDGAGIDRPAVNVRMLVLDRGLEIRSSALSNVSGLLARNGRQAIIGVNCNQVEQRQRFTIAHEFGHYLLHDGLHSHYDEQFRVNYRDEVSSQASDVVEIEANYFAACLLMPRRFLDELCAVNFIDDDAGVYRLSRRFNVSRHAMSLRLANLYPDNSPY